MGLSMEQRTVKVLAELAAEPGARTPGWASVHDLGEYLGLRRQDPAWQFSRPPASIPVDSPRPG